MNSSNSDLVLFRVCIRISTNLNSLGEKFDSKLTFDDHVRGIVSFVYQRIGILSLVKRVFVDTYVFLRCYYAFVHAPKPGVLFSCAGITC